MKQNFEIASVQNVAAGSTFTIQLPPGNTYDRVDLQMGGSLTAALIGDLELIIDGKTVRSYVTGTDLDSENQYWDRGAVADGMLSMHFFRPEMEEVEEANLLSLGTVGLGSIIIRGDISAAAGTVTLKAHAQIDTLPKMPGLITKVRQFPTSAGASGVFELSQFPKAASAAIVAMHLKKSDVDTVTVMQNTGGINSNIIDNVTKTVLHRQQTRQGFVPQSGFTHLNFIPHRQLADAVATGAVSDLRARLTLGTSGALLPYVEYVDTLNGV